MTDMEKLKAVRADGGWQIMKEGNERPIAEVCWLKAYYTDYPPCPRNPEWKILSDKAAAAAGNYVATPEILAAIEAEVRSLALKQAAAPELYEVVRQLAERDVAAGAMPLDDDALLDLARDALAKAEGKSND